MNEIFLTALATVLLVFVGLAQVAVLIAQKGQTRIALTAQYRSLWVNCKKYWGNVIFIGREQGEYYQVLDETEINELIEKTKLHRLDTPTIWALDSIQKLCGILGEVSTRVLQGHLNISDVYPIFGTEFLRHSRLLRQLLEPEYQNPYFSEELDDYHKLIRNEMQDWLIYHDGLRRRCLILIDLLWAEAARLEDLPPSDMEDAANSKEKTGKLNRQRVFQEVYRLNGLKKLLLAYKLTRYLRRAEYQSMFNQIGINKKRLKKLNEIWTKRLLRHR
jgi:hypothetical protein